jgi:hypothetical protein
MQTKHEKCDVGLYNFECFKHYHMQAKLNAEQRVRGGDGCQ